MVGSEIPYGWGQILNGWVGLVKIMVGSAGPNHVLPKIYVLPIHVTPPTPYTNYTQPTTKYPTITNFDPPTPKFYPTHSQGCRRAVICYILVGGVSAFCLFFGGFLTLNPPMRFGRLTHPFMRWPRRRVLAYFSGWVKRGKSWVGLGSPEIESNRRFGTV